MSILLTGKRMERITDALSILTTNVKLQNSRGRTDINADAEDFYCGLLNIVMGKSLQNLNALQMDFPAIDLADRAARLCVQVTSTEGRGKINHTLEKFYERDMQEDFDRLIILVIGEKDNFKKPFPGKGSFVFDPKEDIWDTAKLLAEIERLPEAKQKAVDDYLQGQMKIPHAAPKPISLPVNMSLGDEGFMGRREELSRMAQMLEDGVKPLVIWGLGGMGKTELVSKFGRNYRDGNVYMALFRGTIRSTVADSVAFGIPEIRMQNLDEDQRYEQAIARLALCAKNDVLIIDNADLIGGSFETLKRDPDYKTLCSLPMKLVFTTRMQVRGGIELKPLENRDLYRIFGRHDLDLSVETMDALISAVNAHTMTIDLIARTMDESWETVTPEMILEVMNSSSLPEADYPEVYTDHNEDRQQRQIYAHLRSLFNLSHIPESGRQALRCATLLPECGMSPKVFIAALPKGPAEALRLLEKQGWVRRNDHLFVIHPVVRLVCRTELKPTDENCRAFLDNCWAQFEEERCDDSAYWGLAELYSKAANTLEDRDHTCADRALKIYWVLSEIQLSNKDYKVALKSGLRILRIQQEVFPHKYERLATSYGYVAKSLTFLEDYGQALKYQKKALPIWEKVLEPKHPKLARFYNNLGCTYSKQGDPVKALEYQLKAMDICEASLPEAHPDLADCCSNLAATFCKMGDHKSELHYYMRALEILEQLLPADHVDLSRACFHVATANYALRNYAAAHKYLRRAADIAEQSLPEGHPHLTMYRESLASLEHFISRHPETP